LTTTRNEIGDHRRVGSIRIANVKHHLRGRRLVYAKKRDWTRQARQIHRWVRRRQLSNYGLE
jgi:hypothetical protein